MFYNPVYLKKNGRFGLIWLAATQTKVLSRRQIASIHITRICSDIFCHIPGMRAQGSKASRFSLYLCCQLMYGSVKILQKQWDILLVDALTLSKRCTTAEIPPSTKDIDMVVSRQAVLLESNIPSDEKDKNFDPYFGALKEPTDDVDSILAYFECLTEDVLVESFPQPIQPELGSPHSVSDPKEIQIMEEIAPITEQLVNQEQDLPKMDIENFLFLSRNESFLEIEDQIRSIVDKDDKPLQAEVPQEQISFDDQQTDDNNAIREILMDALPQTELSINQRPLFPLEETPLTKPTAGMPQPPHKPRQDRPKRQRDGSKKTSRFQDICNDELQEDSETRKHTKKASSDELLTTQQNQNEVQEDERGHGKDWAQKNPPKINLPPVSPTASPLRKKQPHKLVIDTTLMICRPELIEHLQNTADIVRPVELPVTTRTKAFQKEPGLKYLKNKQLLGFFTKNCKFGLRMDDTGSEPDSLSSPPLLDFLSRKRTRGEDVETPANKFPKANEDASIEKTRARASSGLSESLERNLSLSMIANASNETSLNTSAARNKLNLLSDHEISREGQTIQEPDVSRNANVLTALAEEPELNISPIRQLPELSAQGTFRLNETHDAGARVSVPEDAHIVEAQIHPPPPDMSTVTNVAVRDSSLENAVDTPRTTLYNLIEDNVRTKNDWTTFNDICPTSSCNRRFAATMFNALLAQIARGKLCARQDEAYNSIFIWVTQCGSGLSTSHESALQ